MATLDEWESRLRPQMAALDLIGELALSSEETEEIGLLIQAHIKARGPQRGIETLRERFPCTLATYLVFQGVYGYTEGNYWSAVCAATGVPYAPNWEHELGQAFEGALTKLGLNRQFAGHRYVGAILGHGGIPEGSLYDFFSRVLQPSITKPEWAGLSTRELIAEWLSSAHRYFVDKPVVRFLEYGGRVAEDFVERCRQMARDCLEHGEVPTPTETGLPPAVVTSYQDWLTEPEQRTAVQKSGSRLHRPRIILEPWGRGVQLVLPEQQLPGTMSLGESEWTIDDGEHPRSIPVQVRRVDRDLKTVLVTETLERPAAAYRIAFLLEGSALREWSFAGTSDLQPLLVFEPIQGTLLPPQRRLPGQLLWLLCPPGISLSADAPIREKLPPLPWEWLSWQGWAVDLHGTTELTLHTPTGDMALAVVPDQPEDQIELIGAQPAPLPDPGVPLYTGRPPVLRFQQPEVPFTAVGLSRWRLELHHEWDAEPTCSIHKTLADLDRVGILRKTPTAAEVPLEVPELLGPTPVGQYRLRLRGPRGRGNEFRFRVAPRLTLTGHEPLYLPGEKDGAPVVQLLVETDPPSQIEFLQHAPDVGLQEVSCNDQSRRYQVDVPPERTEVPLRLTRPLSTGATVRLPLHVPIRRLRWLLALRPSHIGQQGWQSRPQAVSLEELDESASPILLVEIPGIADDTPVQLQLRDVEDTVLQEETAPRPLRPSRFRRFDLRLVRDTLRQCQSPVVKALLAVPDLPGLGPVRQPVLTIRRGIHVETFFAEWQPDHEHLDLLWEPNVPLRWRYIRFWPRTRPWAEPVEFALPDEARGQHTLAVSRDTLPAGEYLVEFTILDPWTTVTHPVLPPETAPNVATCVLGRLEQRMRDVGAALARRQDTFSAYCERIFLRRAMRQESREDSELGWCYEHIEEATLEQMAALVREFRDHPVAKAMRDKLYAPERLRPILDAYRAGQLSETKLALYLEDLPSVALLHRSSCELLLTVPDERIRLAAAQQLIKRGHRGGVGAVLDWLEHGELSDRDAHDLLQGNPQLVAEVLKERLLVPATFGVLDALAVEFPESMPVLAIRPGCWVRCRAGWGQVERLTRDDGRSAPWVRPADLAECTLHVTLRPGHDAEPVIIRPEARELQFLRVARLYLCTKCRGFAAADFNLVCREHNHAAHQGLGPSFAPHDRAVLLQMDPLEFRLTPPDDSWA